MILLYLQLIEESKNKMDVDANQNEMFAQGGRGGYHYDNGRGRRGRRGGQACPMNQTFPRQSANLRLQRFSQVCMKNTKEIFIRRGPPRRLLILVMLL